MNATITVSAKALGQRKKLLDDWVVPVPPEFVPDGERGDSGTTLRDLITHLVHQEVQAFYDCQAERRLLRVLSSKQIEQEAEQGKVNPGGSDLNQKVDVDAAVATALVAFEDGMYLVAIDQRQYEDLDAIVFLHPDSQVAFIRLTFLAGG